MDVPETGDLGGCHGRDDFFETSFVLLGQIGQKNKEKRVVEEGAV